MLQVNRCCSSLQYYSVVIIYNLHNPILAWLYDHLIVIFLITYGLLTLAWQLVQSLLLLLAIFQVANNHKTLVSLDAAVVLHGTRHHTKE